MTKIISKIHTKETINEVGDVVITTDEITTKIELLKEPDYIKIYTKMWCEFNEIPICWRNLFMELVIRMSYSNSRILDQSQIVVIYGPITKIIMQNLKWKDRSMLSKGLKALCDCNAIKKVDRATYQINPEYAGKGEWRYNPKLDRGGVENLKTFFNFKDKTIRTEIIWADDGNENEINTTYREALGVNSSDNTILKTQEIKTA